MKNRIFLTAIVATLPFSMPYAQDNGTAPAGQAGDMLHTSDIGTVLQAITENNHELQSLVQSTGAAKLQLKTENMLEDPTVEYSSFYSRNTTGQSGSELVVSQGFDFPTIYATRHSQNEFASSSLDRSLDAGRRQILLQAKETCLDMIMYRQLDRLLSFQSSIAEDLLDLFRQKYAAGDASSLEVNRIKMELMDVATRVADNNAAMDAAGNTLKAMNGGIGLIFDADFYPLSEDILDPQEAVQEYMESSAEIMAAEDAAKAAEKQVSLNRQNWIPKLEIGYRRNTAIREAENGFIVGGSIPIFSNHRKVAQAKAQSASAHNQLNGVKARSKAEAESLVSEIEETGRALESYDKGLMQETLSLLKEALEGGQISVIEYFMESSSIYTSLSNCIVLENRYQKLLARLYVNRL